MLKDIDEYGLYGYREIIRGVARAPLAFICGVIAVLGVCIGWGGQDSPKVRDGEIDVSGWDLRMMAL